MKKFYLLLIGFSLCLTTAYADNTLSLQNLSIDWHEAGLHTAERIQSLDRKPGNAAPAGQRQMDADEQAAIARMLQEV